MQTKVVRVNRHNKTISYVSFGKIMSYYGTEPSPESRQQRGFALVRGGFTFVQEGLYIKNWQKFHWFIVFQSSIWGDLELCLGRAKPIKAPDAKGLLWYAVSLLVSVVFTRSKRSYFEIIIGLEKSHNLQTIWFLTWGVILPCLCECFILSSVPKSLCGNCVMQHTILLLVKKGH